MILNNYCQFVLIQPWFDEQMKQSLQLFHPLDSKKISKTVEFPLLPLAKEQPCFIPRQRLLVFKISQEKVPSSMVGFITDGIFLFCRLTCGCITYLKNWL